ncbi:MAG TPA: GNAT family N-acetyltransferase [Streptosporangiaceae bacterium]|nr:GNAT family N-acetyltransferase [Streptosporangiaceae bacterium]
MLRTRAASASALRLLSDHDRDEALALCDRDPVTNVFVSARIRGCGLDPMRLGAQIWGYQEAGRLVSLCYSGANLVPVQAVPAAVMAFAERARRQGRRCSSIAGPADAVADLWGRLTPHWDRPRDVRACQPLMAIAGDPQVEPDPQVRRVRPDEVAILLPASIAMFTEEVGVSPIGFDGGAAYRARVSELVCGGRSFARIEDGSVTFKAEVGAVTPHACQVQGVWVPPDRRGRGHASRGMAAVVAIARRTMAPVVSLYVNDFNAPARAAYQRVGFTQVGTFMSVLF